MGEIYGAAWVNQYGENGGSGWATWCKALAGMSINDIAAGVERLFDDLPRYPPNLPQFRDLCIGNVAEKIGLDSEEAAYLALLGFVTSMPPFGKQKDFSVLPPAMYWMYKNINAYSWARMNEKDSRTVFARKYKEAIRLAKGGHEFERPPLQIETEEEQKGREHAEKMKDPIYAQKCRQKGLDVLRELRAGMGA
jgi:hypothetical protein